MIIDIEAEDIPVKRWILSLCLPIGFALLFVRLLRNGAGASRPAHRRAMSSPTRPPRRSRT